MQCPDCPHSEYVHDDLGCVMIGCPCGKSQKYVLAAGIPPIPKPRSVHEAIAYLDFVAWG